MSCVTGVISIGLYCKHQLIKNRIVMRHLKLLFAAVAVTLTTSVVANNNPGPVAENKSVSYEIEKMLAKSNLIVEGDLTLRVLFTISEDKEIMVKKIKCDNEEINEFIMEKLQNRKVFGKNWVEGKLYELPIRVQAIR